MAKIIEKSKNTIIVEYSQRFHRHLFYPVNDLGKKMAEYKNRKSFVHRELEFLKSIGFEIQIVFENVDAELALKEASKQELRMKTMHDTKPEIKKSNKTVTKTL